jgi:hypothetical protein
LTSDSQQLDKLKMIIQPSLVSLETNWIWCQILENVEGRIEYPIIRIEESYKVSTRAANVMRYLLIAMSIV